MVKSGLGVYSLRSCPAPCPKIMATALLPCIIVLSCFSMLSNAKMTPKTPIFSKNIRGLRPRPGALPLHPLGAAPQTPAVRHPSSRNATRASLAKFTKRALGTLRVPRSILLYWLASLASDIGIFVSCYLGKIPCLDKSVFQVLTVPEQEVLASALFFFNLSRVARQATKKI